MPLAAEQEEHYDSIWEKIHVHIFLVEKYISYVYEVYTHTNLENNIILPYFKIYCKATVIKIVWC